MHIVLISGCLLVVTALRVSFLAQETENYKIHFVVLSWCGFM